MKRIFFIPLLVWSVCAAPPPAPPPAVGNPFTTNKPPATITNQVPLVQQNYIQVEPPLPGPTTNFWGGPDVQQNVGGLIAATNIVNGMVNVMSFGTTGDGATDDLDALQRGIDAVSAANGEMYLGSGTYRLSSSLVINRPCRLSGVGATILVPDSVPAIVLNNFTNGIIRGIRFLNTSTTGFPPIAIYGANDNLSGSQILNNRFTRCRLMLRDSAIFDTVPGNEGIQVIGNTWDGNWGMTTFVSDTSQCIDLRGAQSVLINDNIFDVTDEQRFAHLSSCYDVSVNDNTFRSLSSTNADVGIDFFADCRKISFADNKFTMTNTTAQVVIYGKSSGMGPEGMIESQHTQVDISNNIIDFSSDSANAIPIAVYGPWGQPDETLSESTINVTENQITRRVPNSSNPGILVRGFSSANVNLNIVAGTNSQAFLHSVEVDNCETANIIGNIIDQGRITGQGVSYSPQAIQYEKLPVNFTISYNTIKSFKQLGGIWISQCTNLANFTAIGNNIWTAPSSSSASGLIYLYQSPGITNTVVMGTTGFSDNGNHYVLEASTTVSNPTVVNNFWQSQGTVYSVVPATTNIVIDFKQAEFQTTYYLNDDTNANLHFSATNCLPGKYPVLYRLQAGATNRNITFDGSFVLSHGYPTMVSSNRTLTLEFWSFSTNCGSANVTVRPMGQNADEAPVNYRNITVNSLTRPDAAAVVNLNSDHTFGTLLPFQNAQSNRVGLLWRASDGFFGITDNTLGTYLMAVSPTSGYTGTGVNALFDDGTYKPVGGITINPTDLYLPYRTSATTFGNSPWYRIATNSLGFNGTWRFLYRNENGTMSIGGSNSYNDSTANTTAVGNGTPFAANDYSTFIGSTAGANTAGTEYNTFIGYAAGTGVHEGDRNTLIGRSILQSDTTNSLSTIIGSLAATGLRGGSSDVIIGESAGTSGTNSLKNVVVGYQAGGGTGRMSVTNMIVLGADANGMGSNTAQIGTNGVTVLYLNGTVGWFRGSGDPENAVEAPVGSFFSREDGGTGTAFYVKETGGAGNTGWVAK